MENNATKLSFGEKLNVLLGKDKDNDGIIYKENRLLKSKNRSLTNYRVKEGTEIICDNAFSGKGKLHTLYLPESVSEIGEGALPKNVSTLEIWNPTLSTISNECFDGYIPGNLEAMKVGNNLTVKTWRTNMDKLRKKLDKSVTFKILNSRPPVDLGLNKSGEVLSYAKIVFTISEGAKIVRINKKDQFVLAKPYAGFGVTVSNSQGRVLFSDRLVLDGDINGFEVNNNIKLSSLPPETQKLLALNHSQSNGIVSLFLKKSIKENTQSLNEKDKFYDLEVVPLPAGNKDLKIEFTIKVENGIFDSSKLNFIYFDDNGFNSESRLSALTKEFRFPLNFISYNNTVVEGVVGSDFFNSSNIGKVDKVRLKQTVDFPSDSYLANVNFREETETGDCGPMPMWSEAEKVLTAKFPWEELSAHMDPKTDKWGFIHGKMSLKIENVGEEDQNSYSVFKDENGNIIEPKWVIEPLYDEVVDFSDGLARVREGEKWGYINSEGEIVVPAKFDDCHNFIDGRAFVKIEDEWGLINKEGAWVVRPIFTNEPKFKEGLAVVRIDDKYGFINTNGKYIVKPKYEDAKSFHEGRAAVLSGSYESGYKWGFIDKTGKIVCFPVWDDVRDFSEGRAAVAKLSLGKAIGHFIKDKLTKGGTDEPTEDWGFIDYNGNVIVPLKYYDVDDYSDGKAKVYKTEMDYDNDNAIILDLAGNVTH